MKTLADLKRDIKVGTALTLIESEHPGHRYLNLKRYVVKVQGNGAYLSENKDATAGSFMDYPKKAALCEYTGDTIAMYRAGHRELTDAERKVLETLPSRRAENAKQCEIDMMTDGSSMYWADKKYLADHKMEYLSGTETVRGLRYDYNTGKIEDESIKGALVLKYRIDL